MAQNVRNRAIGRVCLVGAGPGDPGLITVVGLRRLKRAEVVVFDSLANPVLVQAAPRSAERIPVGKRAGRHKLSQDQINELLADRAEQGKFVVRLKGGDPYLFGRGGEEMAYLGHRGIPCEVVAGITAGIAGPATAGIPVTHRSCASTVTFITGHEDPRKSKSAVDYEALGRLIGAGGTACFYMAAERLDAITKTLINSGLDQVTPAAMVQWGTLPRQSTVRSDLGHIAVAVERAGIGAPAVLVVGLVASIDEPGLAYFVSRPLFGQRILITRSRPQASLLRRQLEGLGAEVLEAPTIKLAAPSDWAELDEQLRQASRYDWLVLTSANGVRAVAFRLRRLGLDARHFAGLSIAVIGDATAEALRRRLGLRPDLVPPRFVAEELADQMVAEHDLKGRRVLWLRADTARPVLAQRLTEAGACVREVVVYRSKLAGALPKAAVDALRQKRVEWVTFTSSSIAKNMEVLLGSERHLLDGVRIASIGPITSEAIRQLGFKVSVEAEQSNMDGLVEAIVAASRERS